MADSTVLDDYELIGDPIATGNSTQVWEVKKGGVQQFAMKLLLPEAFADGAQKASLKHEANVGKSFDHPNLIRIFELVMRKKYGYFIMEYFRSQNLKQMIRGERAAAQARLKKMMEALSQGLAHMHEKGWLHRDIKPDNILLTKGSEVKLIDFSLAGKGSGALTKLIGGSKGQAIQGTRTYIAPEVVRRKAYGFQADIYSLGITCYEVATGRPPYIHSNPNELLMAHVKDTPEKPSGYNPNITPELDAFILRLISKKPENRPANMQEVFSEVRNLKFFKEEPEEHARELARKAEDKFQDSMASRLDSRSDAARDKNAPPAPKPEKKPAPVTKPAAAGGAAKPAVAMSPQQPQPMPGYPQQPMPYPPGQFPGGQFPPGQYPPGYPPQMPYGYPGQMPGQPAPGQAPPPGWGQGYPPQQMPPGYGFPPGYGAMPGQPAAPAMPAPAPPVSRPAAPQPVAAPQRPAAVQPLPQRAPEPDPDDEDNLPLMTELPEVM